MLPSSTNRSCIVSAMASTPASASRPRSCQTDGLKRSGFSDVLGNRRLLRSTAFPDGWTSGAEDGDPKAPSLPGLPIETITRVEQPLAADQRRHEVHVQLLE